jgi:hypothetical protein
MRFTPMDGTCVSSGRPVDTPTGDRPADVRGRRVRTVGRWARPQRSSAAPS